MSESTKPAAAAPADPSGGVVTSESREAASQPAAPPSTASPSTAPQPAAAPPAASPSTTPQPAAAPPAASPSTAPQTAAQQPVASPPAAHPPALRWPSPDPAGAPRAVVAALVAGVVGAAALTWSRPGVGWLLTGLCAFAGVLIAVWGSRRREPAAVRVERVAWGLAAVVLLATGTLLAAGWLFVLAVMAAVLAGTLAVAGGRTAGGLFLSLLVWPVAVIRSGIWAGRARVGRTARSGVSTVRIVAAVAVTVLLLLIFGSLLAGADAAFAKLLDAALPHVDGEVIARWIFGFALASLTTLGACFLASAPPELDTTPGRRRLRRVEWALPIGALVLLFAAFVVVQGTVLFGGDDYVQNTVGVTYAEYARSGFWQLLTVTVLVLGVIAVAARLAPRETALDRAWIRVLFGSLVALTLVIVASAMSRMWAYEQAYGFTRLRVLVSAVELWLGVVLVLLLIAGISLRRPARWLPGTVVATGVAILIGLAALNPDRFIADRNIDRLQAGRSIDYVYLASLSADAVPALMRLPEPLRSCALHDIARDLERPDEWREWNLGRSRARDLLAGEDFGDPADPQWTICNTMANSNSTRRSS